MIIFGFLSWIILMAGMSATTAQCQKSDVLSNCANQYQQEWWAVWFEFFLLVAMISCAFINAFDKARLIFLTYLAMVTVLLTEAATYFTKKTVSYYQDPTTGSTTIQDVTFDAYGAAAAGAVLCSIANFALIIFVGKDIAYSASVPQGYAGAGMDAKYQPSAV